MASGSGGRKAAAREERRAAAGAERPPHGREILALVLVGAGLFLTVSALSYRLSDPDNPLVAGTEVNWGGAFGHYLGGFFVDVFGLACYPFFGFVVYWGLLLLLRRDIRRPVVRVSGAVALMLVFAVFLAGPELRGAGPRTPFGSGGVAGHFLAPRLYASFGGFGVVLLLLVTAAIAFLVATDWPLHAIASDLRHVVGAGVGGGGRPSRLRGWAAVALARLRDLFGPAAGRAEPGEAVELAVEAGGVEVPPVRLRRSPARAEPATTPPEKPAKKGEQALLPIDIVGTPSVASKTRKPAAGSAWTFPPFDLLHPAATGAAADPATLRRSAEAIERRLGSHNIAAEVVCISAGPAVTVFELELAEGLRVASLTKYAPDLAAALEAYSVRVVAPIPGKHTVGVEVPNETRSLVRLRELIALRTAGKTAETVPLFLGRDVAGKILIEDLARMPHLLIAGATGSGKSVCINSILLSMLLMKSPDEVRLILIDPKMVELQAFKGIPHLLCPVVTSTKQVPRVLDWAVETMEQRYALLSAAGVRNLDDYNGLGEKKLMKRLGPGFEPERTPVHMPAIVMIIDEFADLMAVAANEIEVSIQRLAQKSRAVGIHVILATQRPSRDVITGLIKANLPTRIAFQVSSRVDSRVVLDSNGAEQLLGHGDLLYIPPGTNRLVRAQGTFVSDDEIRAVVDFVEQHAQAQSFEQSLVQVPTGSGRRAKERDALYEEAVRCILEEQRGSATLLQRKLSVGYTRASRLIELMCEDGIVGDFVGSKSREVLMTLDQWEAQNTPVEEGSREGEEALLEEEDDGDCAEEEEEEEGEEQEEEARSER